MATTPTQSERKADHLRIAAGPDILHTAGTGLEQVRLRHRALPERDLGDVDLTTRLFGATLRAPLVISAMTGGTDEAATINGRLIAAAGEHGIALVLGSGRRLLDDPDLVRTYRPAAALRPPLFLANIGGAQLTGPTAPDVAERLVDLLDADGLSVHLNPLQEGVQPEGEPSFAGVLDGIAAVVERLAPRPVVVKEVGFGLDPEDVRLLAGAGGTNWALIEGRRDPRAGALAEAFADWGSPTAEAVVAARRADADLPLIASGGLRDGVEVAKCLALGAHAAGLARPFLVAAQADRATAAVGLVIDQLRLATWTAGAARSSDLGAEHLR